MRAGRVFLYDTLSDTWEATIAGETLSLRHKADVLLAVTHAVQSAVQAVELMYRVAGTSGVSTRSPLERYFRDVQALRHHAFGAETRYETVGQVYLGFPPTSRCSRSKCCARLITPPVWRGTSLACQAHRPRMEPATYLLRTVLSAWCGRRGSEETSPTRCGPQGSKAGRPGTHPSRAYIAVGVKLNMDIIMTKSDWDYRGLAAECYDLWFGAEPFWDQAFFHQHLCRNGGVALEIACGTGRLLVPFLRDGLAVEGVDASAEMLEICRHKATQVGVTPILYQQLMQDLELDRQYRTIFIPACSFQILAAREEAFEALRRFRAHLEPGGELLMTLEVPWRDFGVERQWRLRRSGVRPSDGATVLIHEATVSDRVEQLQHIWMRHEVFKEGRLAQTQLRTHRLRWYYKHEFVMMLESVGFREIVVQCGYTDGVATDPDVDLVVIAKR